MERIRQSFRRRKNKDRDGDKKFDFQTVFSEAELEEPKPLTRLQKIRKSIRSIKKKKKQPIEETIDDQQENEKISLENDEDTDFSKEETEEDPLDKKSKFRLSFRPKKKKKESASDEIDNTDDKAQKEKKKKKKKGSSKWETDEDRVRSNHCEFKVKYLGFIEVDESRGMEVCEKAVKELLQSKGKATKGKLHVTGDGLRVVDKKGGMLVDQVIEKVSFCAPDRNHHHGFAYISRDGTSRRWLCHGFMSRRDSGERLSHAVGVAFAVCLENKQAREREGVTSTYNEEDGTFTRFGSFRQGTITERLQNPQEFKESAEKNIEVVENPFAIARPRPGDARASMRAIGIKGAASPFKRGGQEYSSLRVNELPSNISRKEKSRVSLILEENFENEETKNEINEMILQMSKAKTEEPKLEELMTTSVTSDFSESSTTTNPPSIAKTPENATCESNNNKIALTEAAIPPLPLTSPPPPALEDSDNPWDLVPDQPKIKNHSRSNSKHENIKSEAANSSSSSCTNQGDAWLASLSNKISTLEDPPTAAWQAEQTQPEPEDQEETEWAALASRNDSKHVKNNNPFIAFV